MTESLRTEERLPPLTGVQWLICIIAAIGFAFDIYELLMLPLIVEPAIRELKQIDPSTPDLPVAIGMLFYIPALAGGIFGLLGGYLTDRLGRRRVLTWSILLYAGSAFLAGFSTSFTMLLILRCTTFIGVCVEFVAAVAWLAELFPQPKRREKVLGWTQAASSVGGIMVTGAFWIAGRASGILPAISIPEFLTSWLSEIPSAGEHAPWRYTLMSGIIPAIPLIIIRPFLPESPIWKEKRAAGTLKRPSILELFAPQYLRTTIVTTLLFACSYGAAFGAIQHIPRIVPGLPQVQKQVRPLIAEVEAKYPDLVAAAKADPKSASAEKLATMKRAAGRPPIDDAKSAYQLIQEIGGLAGRIILAFLAVWIVSRRALLRVFQVPGLILMPAVFFYAAVKNPVLFQIGQTSITLLGVGIFLAGLFTVAQFSFWGNYLPRMYPVHLRGTGESFAANIGGRMIGTAFAWVTTTLAAQTALFPSLAPGDPRFDPTRLAYAAAAVAAFVYLAGLALSFFLPEPRAETEHH